MRAVTILLIIAALTLSNIASKQYVSQFKSSVQATTDFLSEFTDGFSKDLNTIDFQIAAINLKDTGTTDAPIHWQITGVTNLKLSVVDLLITPAVDVTNKKFTIAGSVAAGKFVTFAVKYTKTVGTGALEQHDTTCSVPVTLSAEKVYSAAVPTVVSGTVTITLGDFNCSSADYDQTDFQNGLNTKKAELAGKIQTHINASLNAKYLLEKSEFDYSGVISTNDKYQIALKRQSVQYNTEGVVTIYDGVITFNNEPLTEQISGTITPYTSFTAIKGVSQLAVHRDLFLELKVLYTDLAGSIRVENKDLQPLTKVPKVNVQYLTRFFPEAANKVNPNSKAILAIEYTNSKINVKDANRELVSNALITFSTEEGELLIGTIAAVITSNIAANPVVFDDKSSALLGLRSEVATSTTIKVTETKSRRVRNINELGKFIGPIIPQVVANVPSVTPANGINFSDADKYLSSFQDGAFTILSTNPKSP